MKERIAILGGVRTPFMSTGGAFEAFPAADLGRLCVTEALERLGIPVNRVGSLTVGSVTQTAGAVHVAKVVDEVAMLTKECRLKMLDHFFQVSRAMPPDQGRKYLVWMQRQTLTPTHPTMTVRVPEPGHPNGHQH